MVRSFRLILGCALLALTALALLAPSALAAGYVYVDQWGSAGTSAGQFAGGSTGVATDRFGTVWAASNSDGRMERFSLGGAFSSQFASGCGNSWGIAVDHSGNVYAPDWTLDRIRVFDQSGAVLLSFGSPGTGKVEFNNPLGIDVADDGTIYVADCYNHRVQYFDKTGGYLGEWGGPGKGDGEFQYPAGIVVDDAAGEVYVADNLNGRVQVFDLAGTYQRQFGTPGSGDGELSQPYGLALDDKYVLVADNGNSRVVRFNTKGQWIGNLGKLGSGDGDFNNPTDVAIDADGALYVSELNNARIQKFAYDETAPVISHDYDGEWHSQPFTVHFSAIDDFTAAPWLRWTTDGGANWTNNGSIPVPAPTTHAWDGVFKPMTGAGDAVSNWAYKTLNIKIDTRAPHSTISGLPASGITGQELYPVISATDIGSGVHRIYYDLDDGGLTELPDSGVVPITTAGAHTLKYWAEDNCADTPNQESPNTVAVTIDQMGPTAFPRSPVSVKRGAKATFKYGLVDDLSSTCTVKLVIKKKTKTVKTLNLGTKASGFKVPEWSYSKSVTITLPAGTYNWTVVAVDQAGNVGSYAPKKLTVKP